MGLLHRIGRMLDFPGRVIRRLITGMDEPGGRDVLRKLGLIQSAYNPPGLDFGDIAGFGAEVATDPLTYLGGVGLTGAGRTAKGVAQLQARKLTQGVALKAARGAGDVERIARSQKAIVEAVQGLKGATKRLGGAPAALSPSWGEQVLQGQRRLLPSFMGVRPAPGAMEAGAAQGLQKAGQFLGGTKIGQGLSWAFNPYHGVPTAARPFIEAGSEIGRQEGILASKTHQGLEKAVQEGATAASTGRKEFLRQSLMAAEEPSQWTVSQAAEDVGREITDIGKRQRAFEIGVGRPVGEYTEHGYVRRALSPQGREWIARQTGKETPFGIKYREHGTKAGSQIERSEELRGLTTTEANRYMQDTYGAPGNFFIEDPALATTYRVAEAAAPNANAVVAKAIVKHFGQKPAPGVQGVNAAEFLKKSGLIVGPEAAGNKVIPFEMADWWNKVQTKLSTPQELQGFQKGMEGINRIFRSSLTVPFPAYHARNFWWNNIATWISGAWNPQNYAKAISEYKGNRDYYEAIGVLKGAFTKGLQEDTSEAIRRGITQGKPKGILRAPTDIPGLGQVYKAGYKVGDWVEGVSRIAHFLGETGKGLSVPEAVASVRKHLFDYSELTDFERKFLKQGFLFYQFTRKVIPYMMGQALEHPAKTAGLWRVATQPSTERENIPSWMRSTLALPSPFGPDKAGNQSYLTGLGLPMEEFAKFDVTGAPGVTGKIRRLLERLALMSVPQVKVPAELMAGKDFYLQRPIAEADKAPRGFPYTMLPGYTETKLPSGRTSTRADPELMYFLRNSPIGRAFQTLGKVTDTTKPGLLRVMQQLSGLRTTSTVEESEKLRSLKERITEALEGLKLEGKAGSLTDYYAKIGEGGAKDPQAQMLVRMLRQIQEANAKAQQARR